METLRATAKERVDLAKALIRASEKKKDKDDKNKKGKDKDPDGTETKGAKGA